MILMGIDFETTGLDPEKDRVIEVASVLWDTDLKRVVASYHTLVCDSTFPRDFNRTSGLNFLSLQRFGVSPFQWLEEFERQTLVYRPAALIGHNLKAFDLPFWNAENKRSDEIAFMGQEPYKSLPVESEFLVIDTLTDIKYSPEQRNRSLKYLAFDHGYILNSAHCALFDVMACFHLFHAYPIEETLARAASPNVRLYVVTQPPWEDQGHSNELAKASGFRYWEPTGKYWYQDCKECDVEEILKSTPESLRARRLP